ncbi:MAG TPA: hypothetical protein ENK46_01315 [Flavobacteriia bacterium]|jgi:hypothetical protein|nr:hypothetical protein [Flavobacteriia bacterium]
MKNLRGVLGGLLIFVIFQLTLVSCTDSNEIIKSQDVEQIQRETKMVVPGNQGDEDVDDDEQGLN